MMRYPSLSIVVLCCCVCSGAYADQTSTEDTVRFSAEIEPILRRNCVACHREKQAEGGLSLETPKAMLVGGDSGALIEPGQPESSLLYLRVSDASDPMPPEDNTVGAKRLTQEELNLLSRWITQGASTDSHGSDPTIDWQPIAESVRTSFSLAVSPDQRFVAVAHANRVELLDSQTGAAQATLVDERLDQPGVADVDLIQAVAISPWGDRIATGGYRTVRIWNRRPGQTEVPVALGRAGGRVVLSPDRSLVALVNALGDIEVRDFSSDEKQFSIPNSGTITHIQWNCQDNLAVAYDNGDLKIYSSVDGPEIAAIPLDHTVVAIDQSPDGRFIASLGSDGLVRLFDQFQLRNSKSLATITDATAIAFASPGVLVVATASGVAKSMDVANDRALHDFSHGSPISTLAISQSDKLMATGGIDGQTKLWSVDDAALLQTLLGDSESQLRLASLRHSIAREQSWIQTLEGKTEELKKLLETEDAALAKVAEAQEKAATELSEKQKQRDATAKQIADTEQQIVATQTRIESSNRSIAKAEASIAESNVQMQSIIAELQPMEKQSETALSQVQQAQAKVNEAMRLLAAAKQASEKIDRQVTEKKSQLAAVKKNGADAAQTLTTAKTAADAANIQLKSSEAALAKQRETMASIETEVAAKQADLSERDQALVTAKKTREQAAERLPRHHHEIRVHNNRLNETQYRAGVIEKNEVDSAAVCAIAFFDADKTVAVVDTVGRIRTFRIDNGKPLDRFQISNFSSMAGTAIAWFAEPKCLVIDGRSGPPHVVALRQEWTLERTVGGIDSDLISDRVTALDFRHDGESLAIGSGTPSRDGQVLIVATSSGERLRHFDRLHSDTVLGLRFSPDDRILATASADKSIRLLDVQTQSVIGALDGHTHHVLAVAWSRDGRLIASGGADGTIKIWDAETGQQRRTIGGFPDEVTAVEFLGDSTRVVSSCADGQVRIHETGNGAQIHAASVPGDYLFSAAISPDAGTVFAAGHSGRVNLWQSEGLKSIGQW